MLYIGVAWHCRWLAHLPEPLKRAGAPQSQCCLFWHPTSADDSWESVSLWKRWKASSFGRSVHLAVQVKVCDAMVYTLFCTISKGLLTVEHSALPWAFVMGHSRAVCE